MRNIFFYVLLLAISQTVFGQTLDGNSFTIGKPKQIVVQAQFLNHYLQENKYLGSGTSTQLSDDEFKHHIIAISPLSMLMTGSNDSVVPAISISYEYVLDGGKVSVYVPFKKGLINQSFYVSPGFKIYPFGQGAIRYAVGPQFTFGSSMHNKYVNYYSYSNGYSSSGYKRVKNNQLGFMVNNSLNATIAKRLYLGLDLGIGVYLYNSEPDDKIDTFFDLGPIIDVQFCTQAGVHLGIRL
ncbi:MAG: hypothetical protein IPI46_00335 [Bacteroidetes bacterium]|nr:hypothetical protein [Bacteroidota bacterium]